MHVTSQLARPCMTPACSQAFCGLFMVCVCFWSFQSLLCQIQRRPNWCFTEAPAKLIHRPTEHESTSWKGFITWYSETQSRWHNLHKVIWTPSFQDIVGCQCPFKCFKTCLRPANVAVWQVLELKPPCKALQTSKGKWSWNTKLVNETGVLQKLGVPTSKIVSVYNCISDIAFCKVEKCRKA